LDFFGFEFLFFLFLVVLEFRAADNRIDLGYFRGFFVLGFDKVRSEGVHLVFAQIGFAVRRRQLKRRSFMARRIRTVSRKGSVFRRADIFFR
jgi:hypothetical protein